MVRGAAACLLAFCVALCTIFRKNVPLGAMFDRAERGVRFLREWQSGHPGDYVAWLTFGTAALGGLLCAAPAVMSIPNSPSQLGRIKGRADTEVTCKDLPEEINMENICLGC